MSVENKKLLSHELFEEIHPAKNDMVLKPPAFSNKKIWWLGKCGHEWEALISSRSNGCGCPICSGKKVLKGF